MEDLIDYDNRLRTQRDFVKRRAAILKDLHGVFQWHLRRTSGGRRWPKWRDTLVMKFPMDLMCYAEAFWTKRPDWIIETGTYFCGSALFFADMLTITGGKGRVVTIDIGRKATVDHPKVDYVTASSVDPAVLESIRPRLFGNVMVILDSSHKAGHVYEEMMLYSGVVTLGQYMVVEDTINPYHKDFGPKMAVDRFMSERDDFEVDPWHEDKFLMTVSKGGWLCRTKQSSI